MKLLLSIGATLLVTTRAFTIPTPSSLYTSTSRLASLILETEEELNDETITTTTTTSGYTLDGETIRGPITPLGNYILVKTKDSLAATDGGVLLPDQAKERPTEGKVLASGPGKLHPHTGIRITNPIQSGDHVLFGKFDGLNLVYNDENCCMIRDDNVLLSYPGDDTFMTLDNVTPCRDYVLIELQEKVSETTSGIALAASVTKDLVPCEGTVVRVGEGRLAADGTFTPSPVVVGDFVKFKDYAGNDVMIQGKAYSVVKMVDILCTSRKEEEEAE